jgi:hypothetical protein
MSEIASTNRLSTAICLAILAMGLILIVIGVAWPMIVTPAMVWSPEQAEELQRAGDAFHAAREQTRPIEGQESAQTGDPQASPRALAENRYNRLKADLEAAQKVRTHWGQRVVAVGFGLTIVSGLGYLAARGA